MIHTKTKSIIDQNAQTIKVCQLCGHQGPDVAYVNSYVGGQGYTWFTVCRDERACRRRMEARL